jgi:regulatory protein
MSLLARRDYASGELHAKLEQQGYDGPTVAAAVAELTQERALNDARYAENYVSYHADRGQGPLRIAADLKALGVPADVIETAVTAGPDWSVLAHAIRARKFGAQEPSDWREKARQARFLQYRGFSSDHIRSALGADFDAD